MDSIVLIIEDYIFDLTDPQRTWPKDYFDKVSYTRWAGYELIRLVKRSHSSKQAFRLIKEFKCRMHEYCIKDFNDKHDRVIFDCAYEVASDILEIIYGMM